MYGQIERSTQNHMSVLIWLKRKRERERERERESGRLRGREAEREREKGDIFNLFGIGMWRRGWGK